jgi:hypothetical protein
MQLHILHSTFLQEWIECTKQVDKQVKFKFVLYYLSWSRKTIYRIKLCKWTVKMATPKCVCNLLKWLQYCLVIERVKYCCFFTLMCVTCYVSSDEKGI